MLCQHFRIIPDHLYSQEKIVKKDASRDGWDFVERARTFLSNTEQSRTFWKQSRRSTKCMKAYVLFEEYSPHREKTYVCYEEINEITIILKSLIFNIKRDIASLECWIYALTWYKVIYARHEEYNRLQMNSE